VYDERLTVPWWWWPAAAAIGVLLAAELHLGAPGVRSWLPYVVVVPLTLGLLGSAGRGRIRVADGVLSVPDGERLPLAEVGEIRALDAQGLRLALGRHGDPGALVVHRPWLHGAVQLVLTDQTGTRPYWLVGTRHPAKLAAALEQARSSV
jgi:hypothetical protein